MEQHEHVDEEMLADVLTLMEDEAADGILRACDLFRASVPERLDDIDAAIRDGRFEDAARASHSLRGSAGAFGAKRLSALGLQIEELVRESDADADAAAVVLEEMRREFAIFRDILDARLAQFR
jgi:HPt (histidine-containing phosphotransfer) domain-containing protein